VSKYSLILISKLEGVDRDLLIEEVDEEWSVEEWLE